MITAIDASKTYVTTATATVFKYRQDKRVMLPVGTLGTGATVKFSDSTIRTVNATKYGAIASATGYTPKSGGSSSASGMYVPLNRIDPKPDASIASKPSTPSGGSQGTPTNPGGTTVSLDYYVKNGDVLVTYNGVGTGQIARKIPGGTKVHIYKTTTGTGGQTWGCLNASGTGEWCILRYPNGGLVSSLTPNKEAELSYTGPVSASAPSPAPSNTTTNPTTTINQPTYQTPTSSYGGDTMNAVPDYVTIENTLSNGADAGSYSMSMSKMESVLGLPPKITVAADPRCIDGVNFGRAYAEMVMMHNCIFSLQPCKVKYLPGYNTRSKQAFTAMLDEGLSEGSISGDAFGSDELSGQLWETIPDYEEYIGTVNMLAREISIYLGIGNKSYKGSGVPYSMMNYGYYNMQNPRKGIGGAFAHAGDTLASGLGGIITETISDNNYIHFYATADGTSITDNMTVTTRSSSLEALFNNQLSDLAADIQFLFGSDSLNESIDKVGSNISKMVGDTLSGLPGGAGATLASIVKSGANYLKGGRIVFPQMLDDCNYDRSYSVSCKFVSPSGDVESIFNRCYLPLCYLWPFVLPQMLSDNMYRYPFVARVDIPGLGHCDLACVTGMRIQRGGSDGMCFNAQGLPFEIDVNFDITPMYSKLMVTSTNHPLLFLSNTALHEYLGSMCGVSFSGDQFAVKKAVIGMLMKNIPQDAVNGMLRSWYDSDAANLLRKIYSFM